MKKRTVWALIGAVALCVALALLFVRTEEGEDEKRTVKMGVSIYRGDDTFISNMTGSLQQIASDYERDTGERVYLSIADAQNGQATQNGQIERFLSLSYDVLCVNLVDRTNAAFVIDLAMGKDVPLVFFNREPVPSDMQKWDRVYYVGTDPAENGRLQGQIIVDAYRKNPAAFDKNGDGILQYIMLEGEIRHQDAVLRTEESIKVIREAGIRAEKLDGAIANWERSQAAALAAQYFERYGEQIEVVLCNNDDMALGVIDTVQRLGIDFVNIVGIDGTPQGLEAVWAGEMLGTVVIDYAAQAQLIFDIAQALAVGKDPAQAVEVQGDRSVRAPMYVVTMPEGE